MIGEHSEDNGTCPAADIKLISSTLLSSFSYKVEWFQTMNPSYGYCVTDILPCHDSVTLHKQISFLSQKY